MQLFSVGVDVRLMSPMPYKLHMLRFYGTAVMFCCIMSYHFQAESQSESNSI